MAEKLSDMRSLARICWTRRHNVSLWSVAFTLVLERNSGRVDMRWSLSMGVFMISVRVSLSYPMMLVCSMQSMHSLIQ